MAAELTIEVSTDDGSNWQVVGTANWSGDLPPAGVYVEVGVAEAAHGLVSRQTYGDLILRTRVKAT